MREATYHVLLLGKPLFFIENFRFSKYFLSNGVLRSDKIHCELVQNSLCLRHPKSQVM